MLLRQNAILTISSECGEKGIGRYAALIAPVSDHLDVAFVSPACTPTVLEQCAG